MKKPTRYSIKPPEDALMHDAMMPPPPPPSAEVAMVRTQIYLTQQEHEFITIEAHRRGEPMAAVIRSYIDDKMRLPDEAWTDNPMLRPTPVDPEFNSPPDAAINHDHYLSGAPKKWIKVRGGWVEAPPLPADYYEDEASYAAYHERVRQLEAAG